MNDPGEPQSIDVSAHRPEPGDPIDLNDWPTKTDPPIDKDAGKQLLGRLVKRLDDLQEVLYAGGEHRVLVVMQAMDAGGKDSTIRKVFGPLNPQGVRIWSFKSPSEIELAHDYLWRIHHRAPPAGHINVFNRSHYEDVLIARVKHLVDEDVWRRRYGHINDFERMLADEGTTILKFFLHISPGYQKQRFQRRLDRPDKHWKFNPADLAERRRWDEYQRAYAEAIGNCNTDRAPWYIVPAERKWYRCLVIAQAMVEALEALDLRYPPIDFDPSDIRID